MTPSFVDMDRIMRFLRPMSEGGMGAGSEAWIAYCLRLSPERARAAVGALLDQGRLVKLPDAQLIPADRWARAAA